MQEPVPVHTPPSISRLDKLLAGVQRMQERERAAATPLELERAEALADIPFGCERCQDTLFVLEHRVPGAVGVAVPCTCMPASARAGLAGMGQRYRGASLDNFAPLEGKVAALLAARQWSRSESLVLTGTTGVGKTHLMCALGLMALDYGTRVLFLDVKDYLDQLKERMHPDSPTTALQFAHSVESVELLLLDDLGAEQDTPWAEAQLRDLIDYRYANKLPTVITTNLGWTSMRGRLGPAVASRMSEWHWVEVGGIDVRPTLRGDE